MSAGAHGAMVHELRYRFFQDGSVMIAGRAEDTGDQTVIWLTAAECRDPKFAQVWAELNQAMGNLFDATADVVAARADADRGEPA